MFRQRNNYRIYGRFLVRAYQFKEFFMTGILLVLFVKVKLLLDTERGLTQAEGWKEPRSDLLGGAERGGEGRLAGSVLGKFTGAIDSLVEVGLSGLFSPSSEVSSTIFALLLRVLSASGLPDLARLLGSLVLPGGGEELRFPSNKESCRGGKEDRETYDQDVFVSLGLIKRTKSEVPYLTLVLCLMSPLR